MVLNANGKGGGVPIIAFGLTPRPMHAVPAGGRQAPKWGYYDYIAGAWVAQQGAAACKFRTQELPLLG